MVVLVWLPLLQLIMNMYECVSVSVVLHPTRLKKPTAVLYALRLTCDHFFLT